MKRAIRVICLLVVIVIAITNLNGCNDEKDTAPVVKDRNTDPIIFYFLQKPKGSEYIAEEIHKRSGFKVQFKEIPQTIPDLKEKSLNLWTKQWIEEFLASDTPWDVLCVDEAFFRLLDNYDYFLDMSRAFPEYAPKYYSEFPDEVLKMAEIDGKLLSIPRNLYVSQRHGVYVRKDLLEKYGIESIESWNDFEKYMAAVKRDMPQLPILDEKTVDTSLFMETYGYVELTGKIVYRWNEPYLKLIAWEDTEEFKLAANRIKSWYDNGYVTPGSSNNYAAYLSIGGSPRSILRTTLGDEWKHFIFDREKPTTINYRGLWTFVFNKTSKNNKLAIQFIEWVQSSAENHDLLIFGVEAKDYEVKNREKVRIGDPNNGRFSGINQFFNNKYVPDTGKISEALSFNTRLIPHQSFWPDDELLEYASKRSGIFYREYQIYAGTEFANKLDEFLTALKELDTELIVNTAQKQLDKWLQSRK